MISYFLITKKGGQRWQKTKPGFTILNGRLPPCLSPSLPRTRRKLLYLPSTQFPYLENEYRNYLYLKSCGWCESDIHQEFAIWCGMCYLLHINVSQRPRPKGLVQGGTTGSDGTFRRPGLIDCPKSLNTCPWRGLWDFCLSFHLAGDSSFCSAMSFHPDTLCPTLSPKR